MVDDVVGRARLSLVTTARCNFDAIPMLFLCSCLFQTDSDRFRQQISAAPSELIPQRVLSRAVCAGAVWVEPVRAGGRRRVGDMCSDVDGAVAQTTSTYGSNDSSSTGLECDMQMIEASVVAWQRSMHARSLCMHGEVDSSRPRHAGVDACG